MASIVTNGLVSCTAVRECIEARLGDGFDCVVGRCTNNPYEHGCFYRDKPGWNRKRVCNSDDPVDAADRGICRTPSFDHLELRIFTQNWEASMFQSWVLQIILSELLDVPTTLETGLPDVKLNLYDPTNPFDYGLNDIYSSLETAKELEDCRLASRERDSYEPCAHVIPEIWMVQRKQAIEELVKTDVIEESISFSALGQQFWFVPKFTGLRDPSLVSYLGLQGEENRRKLAERFLRPTTWKRYCDAVSINNCETADKVAQRAPQDKTEESRMFVHGLYTGHFRKTEQNDCDKYPQNCTGHIVDYPCSWSSFVKQQTYWLGIALESSGPEPGLVEYTYSQLTEIVAAANATKSDLIMLWWKPDLLYQTYLGTDAEFTRVRLPRPTQQCVSSRKGGGKCSLKFEDQVEDAIGSCDEPATPLQMIIVSNLQRSINDPSIPVGLRSPAYEVLKLFSLNSLQQGELFDYWKAIENPRAAVCSWANDNYEFIRQHIPRTHPRIIQLKTNLILQYASVTLGAFAFSFVLWAMGTLYKQRTRRIITFSQIEFLWLLLIGLVFISVGAIFAAVSPSDVTCIFFTFFINFGYSFELIPLIVKVAATNKLWRAAQQMRRVVVRRFELLASVALISTIVFVYLIAWLVLDTPSQQTEYFLTEETTADGETIVHYQYYCISSSNAWLYVSVGWYAFLLLTATFLAYQTRTIRQDFSESQTLAIMIYSHCLFVVLRLLTLFLGRTESKADVAQYQSLIYSSDVIVTILIYFAPKFLSVDHETNLRMPSFSQVNRWLGKSTVMAVPPEEENKEVVAADQAKHSPKNFKEEEEITIEFTNTIKVEKSDKHNDETPKEEHGNDCLKNPQEDSASEESKTSKNN